MSDDLMQWLGEQYDEDERLARATHPVFLEWEYDGAVREVRDVGNGGELLHSVEPRIGEHVANHDPARVLREIDAKRQLLADVLSEPHFMSADDHWNTCPTIVDVDGVPVCLDESRAPGPCDCGRDARVVRRLHLLGLPYADRPGYRGEWRP